MKLKPLMTQRGGPLLTARPSLNEEAMSQMIARMTDIPTDRSSNERISIQQFRSEQAGE
jgi:hypothetical protein